MNDTYNISFRNQQYQCRDDETLLQAFLRQGVELKFSCQRGSCQVCMLHCEQGEIPAPSQQGLKPGYVEQDFFLPCQCHPGSDMVIHEIDHRLLYQVACVHEKEWLSEDVCRILLDCEGLQNYQPGQYIHLCRPEDGLSRAYSLASYPQQEYFLELHVKRMQNGELSNWICDQLQPGDAIEVQGPMGECCYADCHPDTPILMVGGGSGLAPLFGIVKQALDQGHRAPVHLYHQVRSFSDLYMHGQMCDLAARYSNLSYFPCVPGEAGVEEVLPQPAMEVIRHEYADLRDWRVYLAGTPELVANIAGEVVARGAAEDRVFADAFDMKELRKKPRNKQPTDDLAASASDQPVGEVDYPAADAELWAALDQGKKLYAILDDFYTIVYDDPRLSPFFQRVTKQRSIEKVSLFLRQVFSGEKVYFGDRPRNAHHWMVISDDLFDYRESIMERCLRDHGLPEHLIARWLAVEESFRPDIVKDRAWKKVVNGVELPLDGYEELELDSGALCDSCQQAIDAGTRVRYHLRLGTVYCPSCMHDQPDAEDPAGSGSRGDVSL